MKNMKFILYPFLLVLFFTACQHQSSPTTLVEPEQIQNEVVTIPTGGLSVRSGTGGVALQMGSGFFKTLRKTSNGTFPFNSQTGGVNLVWTADAGNTTITFSSRTQLATVLSTPSSAQAHHIIPWQWVAPAAQSLLHPTVQAATYAGFHPNNTYNGINLPSPSIHSGSHPAYSAYVKYQLDQYQTRNMNALTFDNIVECQTANTWIQCKLIQDLRVHLNKAITTGTNINTYFTATFPARVYIGN